MDRPKITILNEVCQTDKDKHHRFHLYMESNFEKKYINELIYNTEVDLQISKINLWSPKGKYKDKG